MATAFFAHVCRAVLKWRKSSCDFARAEVSAKKFDVKLIRILFSLILSATLSSCAYQVVDQPYSAPSITFTAAAHTVVANMTLSVSASGGVPPLTYSVVSGGGRVDSTYFYAGTSAETVTLRVTDSIGQTKDVSVKVVVPTKISGGRCVLLSDGTVQCWGTNYVGQVGDGTTTDRVTAVQVSGLTNVVDLSANTAGACAVKSDGSVWCWGAGGNGQNGNGASVATSTPVQVSLSTNATAVSRTNNHACALLVDGSIACWGYNGYGQLGNNSTVTSNTPVVATSPGGGSFLDVEVGAMFSCGRFLHTASAQYRVYCWGLNDHGQLGDTTTTDRHIPTQVNGITTANSIAKAVGGSILHQCAILSNGTMKCWGYNYYGGVGDGTSLNDKSSPTLVANYPSGLTFSSASIGGPSTCAKMSDSNFYCWGWDRLSNLGFGFTGNLLNEGKAYPTKVRILSGISNMWVGETSSCAIKTDNRVFCWGANYLLGIGFSATANSYVPTQSSISSVTQISGNLFSTCARKSNNTAWCWGRNGVGQLGDGTNTDSLVPKQVSGLSTVSEVSAGGNTSCARLADGTVKCWGSNYWGGIGDHASNQVNSNIPVTVLGIATATQITSGTDHNCALLADQSIQCWGYGGYGQLGDGANTQNYVPNTVSGGGTYTQVSAGNQHTCAVTTAGTVECWGYNAYGGLGNNSTVNTNTPVSESSGINTFTKVVASQAHTCAMTSGGAVWCWGLGTSGQLGNGASVTSQTAVQVSGIATAIDIGLSSFGGCAVLTGGTVKCWGDGTYGFLGDGASPHASNTPVTVSNISTASKLMNSAIGSTMCAVTTANTVYCWGNNFAGNYGNGTSTTYELGNFISGFVSY